ncbi:hypothetical protein NDU88_003233 [Pleurodeles waltl]|uniref:Uncharacterized protein n=1 Tax=Pleurodeles waltl TaxID=8319 RepID=A0AAV7LRI1_PLEWA|nr:hypothetical protein NDU88_003233 [Pleurodeles waltl]
MSAVHLQTGLRACIYKIICFPTGAGNAPASAEGAPRGAAAARVDRKILARRLRAFICTAGGAPGVHTLPSPTVAHQGEGERARVPSPVPPDPPD